MGSKYFALQSILAGVNCDELQGALYLSTGRGH
jgi:hypothetical protein